MSWSLVFHCRLLWAVGKPRVRWPLRRAGLVTLGRLLLAVSGRQRKEGLSLCGVFADLTELAMQLSGKAARALECSVDQLDRSAEKQIKGYRLSASGGI